MYKLKIKDVEKNTYYGVWGRTGCIIKKEDLNFMNLYFCEEITKLESTVNIHDNLFYQKDWSVDKIYICKPSVFVEYAIKGEELLKYIIKDIT